PADPRNLHPFPTRRSSDLKKVGFVPLSSNSALAARTARDRLPEIENNFSAARHATVFEGVKITGEASEAIQKMISAPILLDGKRSEEHTSELQSRGHLVCR